MAVDPSVLTDEDKFIDLVRRVLADRGIATNRSDVGRVYDELCAAAGLHQAQTRGLVPLADIEVALEILHHYGGDRPDEPAGVLYRAAEANCADRPMALGLVRFAGLVLKLPEARHNAPQQAAAWPLEVGQVVQLGPQGLWWLVRACCPDGRYALLTTVEEREREPAEPDEEYDNHDELGVKVVYTLVDRDEQVRGAINVIGGGVGIESVCGPDKAVDKAMRLVLEDGFEVSHRNQVHLQILDVRPAC